MAVVFAHVFLDYLIIPVSQVFGSRNATFYFSLMSDIRTKAAWTVNLTSNGIPLEEPAPTAILDPFLADWDPQSHLTPACPEDLHPSLSPTELLCIANATFVDKDGVAAYCEQMRTALLHQNIPAAYLIFSFLMKADVRAA